MSLKPMRVSRKSTPARTNKTSKCWNLKHKCRMSESEAREPIMLKRTEISKSFQPVRVYRKGTSACIGKVQLREPQKQQSAGYLYINPE